MRKLVATLSIITFSLTANAQICGGPALLDEDFSAGIPGGWTVIDNDGLQLTPSMILKGFTGQWQNYTHLGKKCVTNGSQLVAAGTCDDFLITPQITLPVGASCLSWKGSSLIPAYFNEAYEVRVSTTTPTVSGCLANPALIAFSTEDGPWNERTVDLSAYAGQTIYIAFRHIAAGYAFFIDDIRISNPVARDVAVSTLSIPQVVAPGWFYFDGTITNRGTTPMTSVDIHWSIDNGPTNTDVWSFINVLPDSSMTFNSSTPWVIATSGTYTLRVWANNVNLSGDLYSANDTMTKIVFVNTQPRKPLFEDFTQASCLGCDVANWHGDTVLNPYLFTNRMTTIQYHVSWPGVDPMYSYSPGVAMGKVNSYGIAYVPHGVLDGEELENDCNAFIGSSFCLDSNDVNVALVHPAIFDLDVNHIIGPDSITVQVTVTSHADIPINTLRLYTYILEDTIIYASPPGTNAQTDFYHTARYALPDTTGSPIPLMTNGQVLTFTFTHVIDDVNTDRHWLTALAFIQDDSTYYMHQSEVYPQYAQPSGVGVDEITVDQTNVYPNPADDKIDISCGTISGVTPWTIVNVLGQHTISGTATFINGKSTESIDVSLLPPGLYLLNMEISGVKYVTRFVHQ